MAIVGVLVNFGALVSAIFDVSKILKGATTPETDAKLFNKVVYPNPALSNGESIEVTYFFGFSISDPSSWTAYNDKGRVGEGLEIGVSTGSVYRGWDNNLYVEVKTKPNILGNGTENLYIKATDIVTYEKKQNPIKAASNGNYILLALLALFAVSEMK